MLDAIVLIVFILAGIGLGYYGVDFLPQTTLSQVTNVEGLRSVGAAFGVLVFWALGLLAQATYRRMQTQVQSLPSDVLVTRSVGLVIGLLLANLMLAPILLLPIPGELGFIKPLVAVLSSLFFGVAGVNLADAHGRTLLRLFRPDSVSSALITDSVMKAAIAKVLDTSCIIDGRLQDLLTTGFLEGQILVPQFVLSELQTLADSANEQKRGRGRRGLDILNEMRTANPERIIIHNASYPETPTVDAKLVKLAQDISGVLLTTDYNLSKVANFQNVEVLNINDLAQALRPVYLPGDRMNLKLLKEGKEASQGIGYLADGTMVVVEEGRTHIGEELEVVVTGALQTSAGRMIFARPNAAAIA
jgi:uncharacterized protein YacL